ncbi:calcium/sodium antiporter [Flavobacteriaceae bacterium]|jgi:cation:H+ antiporter|nr:calcium/sodium antiporter [Flavobacteriaceae bacterium]|tara:strand:+ start:156 stop:1100 length:945 start_codon:yes stop_codon:yes gene_type:complete
MDIVLMLLGFVLLVVGGEYLVRASVGLSFKLNISKMVIGLTVVSFATSVPELLVSLNAALQGAPSIAINNVIGSNIANIGLVLGITAICTTIEVDKSFYKFNWPALIIFSLLIYYFLQNDQQLSSFEGWILFIALLVFIFLLLKKFRTSKAEDSDAIIDALSKVSYFKILIWLAIGGVALYFGADWLVNGAVVVAQKMGVSEAVISVSLVAVGTSIPELAASIIAVIKKEKAISLGNLIGSNIFNIGSVLGLTSILKTIPVVDTQILSRDVLWMLVFAIVIMPLVLISKRHKLQFKEGFLLVLLYSVFIILVFL